MWYMYTLHRILLSHKKNEVIVSVAIFMDLEITILSEVSQTKTNMCY